MRKSSCQQIQEKDFRRKEHFYSYAPKRIPKWLPFAFEKLQTEDINQLKQKLREEKTAWRVYCLTMGTTIWETVAIVIVIVNGIGVTIIIVIFTGKWIVSTFNWYFDSFPCFTKEKNLLPQVQLEHIYSKRAFFFFFYVEESLFHHFHQRIPSWISKFCLHFLRAILLIRLIA